MLDSAPALIRVPRKTRTGPSDSTRALLNGIRTIVGIPVTLPVWHQGRILAFVRGAYNSRQVWWRPATQADQYRFGWTTYADLTAELQLGKQKLSPWVQGGSGGEVANIWWDDWGGTNSGSLPPHTAPYSGTAYTARQFDDTVAGAIQHGGNVSPDTKHLLEVQSLQLYSFILYDRVLSYDNCSWNANSNQAMTNTLPAQRYIAAGQGGLQAMCTIITAGNATTADLTLLDYTDQDGNAGAVSQDVALSIDPTASTTSASKSARVICPYLTSAAINVGPFLPLGAGDGGVRSIADFTTSAANTGVMCFALVRPLAIVNATGSASRVLIDHVTHYVPHSRIYDGACLAILHVSSTSGQIQGSFKFGWG